jgi:hypothetical protein
MALFAFGRGQGIHCSFTKATSSRWLLRVGSPWWMPVSLPTSSESGGRVPPCFGIRGDTACADFGPSLVACALKQSGGDSPKSSTTDRVGPYRSTLGLRSRRW